MVGSFLATLALCIAPLRAPVAGPLVRVFTAPPCPYCAGHRGVVFGGVAGADVRSPTAGRVTFLGRAFGVLYVVVSPRTGIKVTVGRLDSVVGRAVGEWVAVGDLIGQAGPSTYLGVRVNDVPVDPMGLLARRGAILVDRGRRGPQSLACGTAPSPVAFP